MDEIVMSVGEFVVALHTRVVKLEQENIELRAKLCALEKVLRPRKSSWPP